jgi:hypothetical protein
VHEHYDAEGELTGTTVVTRESAWDEDSRARAVALQTYEADLCKCGCGQPASEAYDPTQVYKVDSFVCQAARAIELGKKEIAKKAEQDRWKKGWEIGRHYYAEPVKGGDDDG